MTTASGVVSPALEDPIVVYVKILCIHHFFDAQTLRPDCSFGRNEQIDSCFIFLPP